MTREEIRAIAAKHNAVQAEQPDTTAGQPVGPPAPIDMIPPWLLAAGAAGVGIPATVGGLRLAGKGMAQIPPLARGAVRAVAHKFGMGGGLDLAEGLHEGLSTQAPPPIAAASEASPPATTVSRSTRVEITPELRRRFPALKHFKSGETISAAQLDKIKLAKAGVPTRPINVQGKPAARAPAQTTEPSYTGGRGASGPELERRAAAMAQATGGRPPLSLVPQEMPQIPPATSLEDQLRQALAAEQAMGAQGLAPAERVGLRAGLRSALPPALEALTFLLGSQQVPQQMEDARRQYLQGAHPDLYRMLYENPNQPMPGSY